MSDQDASSDSRDPSYVPSRPPGGELEPGRTLGDFEIRRQIGQGGMGTVYEALQVSLGRRVALKFLDPDFTRDPERLERFEREAKALAALDHPGIVTVHSVQQLEGCRFISMELVRGKSLAELIPRGGMDLDRFLDHAIPLADALSAAHAHGVIHRDLKPANVMITDDGRVKILDFGLAKLRSDSAAEETTDAPTRSLSLTRTGSVFGTLPYMSPEQVRGEKLDPRSDLFSLGILFHEMATGSRPFAGQNRAEVASGILRDTPPPVNRPNPDLPEELARIVGHCLKKDPERRYQTAKEVRNELEELRQRTSSERVLAESGAPAGARPVRRSRYAGWAVAVGLLLIAGVLAVLQMRPGAEAPASRNRVVVLPFENLGLAEDEYFAAGITEEITLRLAAVSGLAVISRTSAVQYERSGKTIREIGQDLGATHVLEGTVRWDRAASGGGRVRITPQLIRVADDTHVWADAYDGVLDDIFALQSEIARRVVQRLGVTLLEHEREIVELRPTADLEAYQAYLRGLFFDGQPHFSAENARLAEESFERAVALDPDFALAHAKLSIAHAKLYYFRYDLSEERRALARQAVERALELRPDAPEVVLALGYYHLWVEGDEARALDEFTRAGRLLPDSAEVLEAKAELFRKEGRWDEAVESYRNASRLDPLDTSVLVEFGLTFWWMRRYPEALEHCSRAISIAPDQTWPYLCKIFNEWSWKGATAVSRAALEFVPPEHPWAPWTWFWQEMFEGRYREALARLDATPGEWIRTKICVIPESLLAAQAHALLGEPALARAAYESAARLLEAEIPAHSDDARYHSALGIAYAGLGRRDEAMFEARRAVDLRPISEDAVYGQPYLIDRAQVYTLVGEYDEAIDELGRLLSLPSWISPAWIRVDPRWDDLRDHPRYEELLERHE